MLDSLPAFGGPKKKNIHQISRVRNEGTTNVRFLGHVRLKKIKGASYRVFDKEETTKISPFPFPSILLHHRFG